MQITRRTLLAGSATLVSSCATSHASSSSTTPLAADVAHRPASRLPTTELPWLTLRDHFVATVGEHAGEGAALGSLLVLADATFAPHSRFPLHPHREMEILSVVLSGTLSHHGSQAHGSVIAAHGAQLISSRDGIVHAEGNDTDGPTHMLQIWIQPSTRGGEPVYFQRQLSLKEREIIAGDDAMPLRSNTRIEWIQLRPSHSQTLSIASGRHGYVYCVGPSITLRGARGTNGDQVLAQGDGAIVRNGSISLSAQNEAAALWFDTA